MNAKDIEEFLDKLRVAKSDLSMHELTVKTCEDKLQDLLHKLELEELSHHNYAKEAKKIAAVRQVRRQAKDMVEKLTPIVTYCNENKKFFDSLNHLLGCVRKIENRHENRFYRQRAAEE